ncbi:hypothetical protein [Marinicella meishanensis]|uniref:hypothetical protein n=1 Tax=Marinicella meishanensis TaxID=2873263 RepID=UPI001CBCB3C9|nr:hypothetical protein [Marinicella sp. NBU2979]
MLSELEVRRLYIEDFEWERTSQSWKDLKPQKDFNQFSHNDESLEEYYQRLKTRFNIPKPVLKQWLFGLYYDQDTVNNYGWIDFDKVMFKLSELSTDQVLKLRVIDNFQAHVDEGAGFNAYDQLPCQPHDTEFWRDYGTWRTPPIVLDVTSLNSQSIPLHADIKSDLQLVEGHSRLGYFHAINKCGHRLRSNHKVYIMTVKK